MSSNDYYSSSNYATRLIGDNLVIYTPFRVAAMTQADVQMAGRAPLALRRRAPGRHRPPQPAPVRRGRDLPPGPRRPRIRPSTPSRSARWATVGSERDLECRTTAFIGPNTSQWYVTESDAFLWTVSRDYQSYESQACDARPDLRGKLRAGLALPGAGRRRRARAWSARAACRPTNSRCRRRAAASMPCSRTGRAIAATSPAPRRGSTYLDIPLASFGGTVREVGAGPLHAAARRQIALYRQPLHRPLPGLRQPRPVPARPFRIFGMPPAYVVPIDRPRDVRGLAVRHTVVRAEQAGNDIVLTGYRDRDGLFVTLIDLDGQPRIASSVRLAAALRERGPQPRLQQPDRGRRQRRDGPADDRRRELEQPRAVAQQRLGPLLPHRRPARPADPDRRARAALRL